MLDMTRKRVGHGRKREVGNGRRGIQGEQKWGKYRHAWIVTEFLTKSCMEW